MNHQRVVRAIELFSDGGKTLQQVAYEAGFSTPNHFNRVFRQVTGMSPGVFFGKNRLRDRSLLPHLPGMRGLEEIFTWEVCRGGMAPV